MKDGGRNNKLRSVCTHLKSIFVCCSMLMTGHLKTPSLSVEMEPGAFEPVPGP